MAPTNGTLHNSHPNAGFSDPLILYHLQKMIRNDINGPGSSFSSSPRFNLLAGEGLLDPRRSIDAECGYPPTESGINVNLYRMLYDRENIAARVVEVWPKLSWQTQPTVYESEDPKVVTDFETKWDELSTGLTAGGKSWYYSERGASIWEKLLRADIISGIGHFGVILLGVNDGRNFQEPIDGAIMAINKGIPDCFMTKDEEDRIRSGFSGQSYNMNFDTREIIHEGKPLNKHEEQIVNNEAKRRDRMLHVLNAQIPGTREPLKKDPSYSMGQPLLQGTDLNYDPGTAVGMPAPEAFGASVGYALSGTDQQYFGVISGVSEEFADKPAKKNDLLFLMPYPEDLVQIVRYEWNIRNPRFGLPVMYRITLNDPREIHSGIGLPLATVFVHWSRVIHIADNLRTSNIFGVPRMRPVLNRILDLRKLYSGGAEGVWKGISPGLSFETHPQLGGDVIVDEDEIHAAVNRYNNSLQRDLIAKGGSWKQLTPSMIDPSPLIEKQIEAICITLGIPTRVFKGSERGELASSQDDSKTNDNIVHRQNFQITPQLITPTVDRLIQVGVLPEPGKTKNPQQVENRLRMKKSGKYIFTRTRNGTVITNKDNGEQAFQSDTGWSCKWPDIDSTTDKDKAGIISTKTTALVAYSNSPAPSLMPPHNYFTQVWGMEDEEVESMLDDAEASQEDPLVESLQEQSKPTPPPGMGGDKEGQGEDSEHPPTGDDEEEDTPPDDADAEPEEPIANENPNHDERGRFASGSGGGLGGKWKIAAPHGDPIKTVKGHGSNYILHPSIKIPSVKEVTPPSVEKIPDITFKHKAVQLVDALHAHAFNAAHKIVSLGYKHSEAIFETMAEHAGAAVPNPIAENTGLPPKVALEITHHVFEHVKEHIKEYVIPKIVPIIDRAIKKVAPRIVSIAEKIGRIAEGYAHKIIDGMHSPIFALGKGIHDPIKGATGIISAPVAAMIVTKAVVKAHSLIKGKGEKVTNEQMSQYVENAQGKDLLRESAKAWREMQVGIYTDMGVPTDTIPSEDELYKILCDRLPELEGKKVGED